MTNAQKAWLDAHKDYSPVGVAGGHANFQSRGVLKADGTYVRGNVADHGEGAFEVGARTLTEPGQPPRRL